MLALGIDIGGSGIKAAIVDTAKGELVSERIRLKTPEAADASKVIRIIRQLLEEFEWRKGPVGIGFPGVIRGQVIRTSVNLDKSLIGLDFHKELKDVLTGPVRVINDADAAGYAEMRFGSGRPFAERGSVLLLTVGTGIGTVIFADGVLVPNLELGHIEINGTDAEKQVSERTRKEEGLSWKEWGKRFNGYLKHIAFLTQPDLIILGGGGVKKPEKFEKYIQIETEWTYASFGNKAGIIGAAAAAADSPKKS